MDKEQNIARIMRITKTMASTAALLMAGKTYNPIVKQAQDRLNSYVLGVIETIPQEILIVCQLYPKIMYVTRDVYYRWNGKQYHVTLPFNIPAAIRSLHDDFYTTDMKMRIQEACQAVFKAEYEREQLKERIEQILIGLRTRKRIESDFPEASEFIEWPEDKQVPAVPVPNEIRKLFQKK